MARKNIKVAASELRPDDIIIIPSCEAKITATEESIFPTYGGQEIPLFYIKAKTGPYAEQKASMLVNGKTMIEIKPRPTRADKAKKATKTWLKGVFARVFKRS